MLLFISTSSSRGAIVEYIGDSRIVGSPSRWWWWWWWWSSSRDGGGGGCITFVHRGSHLQRWSYIQGDHFLCFYLPFPPEYLPLPEYKSGILRNVIHNSLQIFTQDPHLTCVFPAVPISEWQAHMLTLSVSFEGKYTFIFSEFAISAKCKVHRQQLTPAFIQFSCSYSGLLFMSRRGKVHLGGDKDRGWP